MAFAARISAFTGELPKISSRLLPASASQAAENVILTAGRLDPMFDPSQVGFTNRPITQTIYRMFSGTTDYWLSWNSDVDVAKTPLAGDVSFRISYTANAFEPRTTNLAMATAATPYPAQCFVLGVTPPITKPTVTVTGGSGTSTEDRYYINTFVTSWGEESAPSVPSTVATGYSNGTWTVSGMDTAPPNAGTITAATYSVGVVTATLNSVFGLRAGEYITFSGVLGMTSLNTSFKLLSVDAVLKKVTVALTTAQTYTSGGVWNRDAPHNTLGMTRRIYRTATGSSSTSFLFVTEVPVATTSFVDTVTGGLLAEPCPSVNWLMPPADLRGLQTLPNGSMIGFSGNDLCFSDPYHPFAWPVANMLTTDFPIVGVGLFGQSAVVCTTGSPYVATGIDPSSMTMERIPEPWPCVSKVGIASLNGSVYFPTPMGLASIGSSGTSLVSQSMFSQRDWVAIAPETFVAAQHDGQYYTMYTVAGVTKVLTITPSNGVMRFGQSPSTLYDDASNGKLYAVIGTSIYDMLPPTGAKLPMSWVSKEFVVPTPLNLAAAQVNAAFAITPAQAAALTALNASIAASNAAAYAGGLKSGFGLTPLNVYPVNGDPRRPMQGADSITFTLFAEGQAVYSTVVSDSRVFRLPSLSKYDNFYFSVSGTMQVSDVVIGESVEAIKSV